MADIETCAHGVPLDTICGECEMDDYWAEDDDEEDDD